LKYARQKKIRVLNEGVTMTENIDPPPPQDDLDRFMSALTDAFQGKAGNKALRERLGWGDDPDRYWAAHGRALDAGRVVKGQGKGGSVRLPNGDLIVAVTPDVVAEPNPEYQRELDLYPAAMRVIEQGWVKEANYDDHLIEITAAKGKAATGGKWSRPDVSVLAMKAFPYLPNRLFDIVTFEIKPAGQTTVEGVFEALSHQQFANRAYVIFHVPDPEVAEGFLERQPHAERILSTARRHGVGVIVAQNIADWDTWDEIVPAERAKPDPEQANRFIATCFTEPTREQIIKWHK
jgi:hypothetical protein